MVKPGRREKKISLRVMKGIFLFLMNGLAGKVKNSFPMSGEATIGEILFFTMTAKPSMGKRIYALSDDQENFPIPTSLQKSGKIDKNVLT